MSEPEQHRRHHRRSERSASPRKHRHHHHHSSSSSRRHEGDTIVDSEEEREKRWQRRHRDERRVKDRESEDETGDRRRHHHHHRRRHNEDEGEAEREERKRQKKQRSREKRREGKKSSRGDGLEVVDDDGGQSGDDRWLDRDLDTEAAVSTIPTADSLPLTSNPSQATTASLPQSVVAESSSTVRTAEDVRSRPEWMLDPTERTAPGGAASSSDRGGEVNVDDFFSNMGTVREKKERPQKPDPNKLVISSKELNTALVEGKEPEEQVRKIAPGSAGSNWRMMKLRKVYEQAEEEGRPVEEVALERYSTREGWEEALEERRLLDQRESRRSERRGGHHHSGSSTPGGGDSASRRFIFNDDSRPSSRNGFRKPGEDPQLRRTASTASVSTPKPQPSTPIPSVLTPSHLLRKDPMDTSAARDPTASHPPLSLGELNKLQAKVLRARLNDDPKADDLEKEYQREVERAKRGEDGMWTAGEMGRRTEVQVLPTLDGHGNLYDIGTGQGSSKPLPPGNRKPKLKNEATYDHTGAVLRYNTDDDKMSLGELVRQERFRGGANDQKNLDWELAANIAADTKFESDLDYMDDNTDRLAKKRMKTDAMKRDFAIRDFSRTKKALDTCAFCYQDNAPPKAAVVAMGRRVYLACTVNEELVDGHCLIVPIQHTLSMLELDDDDWEEVKNFMKCLMRMFAERNQGVIFYETVLSLRQQRHTYIEALPLPADEFASAPGYFREAILSSESEWSQHKKLIDFSSRPGGFRRMMVPKLPYFMVQWDYKGEKGYGHVIEGEDQAVEDDSGNVDEGDRAGPFPRYFAAEIIGSVLDLEPRKWRRPKRIDYAQNKSRASKLGQRFKPFDWTEQLKDA